MKSMLKAYDHQVYRVLSALNEHSTEVASDKTTQEDLEKKASRSRVKERQKSYFRSRFCETHNKGDTVLI